MCLILCNAEILVNLHDAFPTDLNQIFKGHYGFAHLQGAEHRVDAVRFSGQRDVVAHCGNLRVGGNTFLISNVGVLTFSLKNAFKKAPHSKDECPRDAVLWIVMTKILRNLAC